MCNGTLVGEIKNFAGSVRPLGYLFCKGQEVDKIRYANLYAVIGDAYNPANHQNSTTFCVPNYIGRGTLGVSSNHSLGYTGGSDSITLTVDQLPAHRHNIGCNTQTGDTPAAEGNILCNAVMFDVDFSTKPVDAIMNVDSISDTGSNQPISIMNPYLCTNFIIYTGV